VTTHLTKRCDTNNEIIISDIMNAQNTQKYCSQQSADIANADQARRAVPESVESQSIRVVVSSIATRHCDHCGTPIDENVRYRNVTTRDSAGNVTEYAFCGVDCKTARFPRLG
jgi:predicted nucleic acid-binding Zn ribbon protein